LVRGLGDWLRGRVRGKNGMRGEKRGLGTDALKGERSLVGKKETSFWEKIRKHIE